MKKNQPKTIRTLVHYIYVTTYTVVVLEVEKAITELNQKLKKTM